MFHLGTMLFLYLKRYQLFYFIFWIFQFINTKKWRRNKIPPQKKRSYNAFWETESIISCFFYSLHLLSFQELFIIECFLRIQIKNRKSTYSTHPLTPSLAKRR